MNDRRWGFEDAEDWEYEEASRHEQPVEPPEETVAGQDTDGVVTVHLGPVGDVVSVRLSADWRNFVDPRALGPHVRDAANNAVLQVATLEAQRVDREGVTPTYEPASAFGSELSPLSKQDVERLLAAATEELANFTRRASEVGGRVEAESVGGHVSGSARRGQVVQVNVDATWAARARAAEIESELTDLLMRLRNATSVGDLAGGPTGPALAELTALVHEPQTLLRRMGLLREETESIERGSTR